MRDVDGSLDWEATGSVHQPQHFVAQDWFGQPESASTTPASSTSVAAVRWFELFANYASRDAIEEADVPPGLEGGFLDPFNGQDKDDMTPLQRATKTIDGQPEAHQIGENIGEEDMWQALQSISLLDREQALFVNFLDRICPWVPPHPPAD